MTSYAFAQAERTYLVKFAETHLPMAARIISEHLDREISVDPRLRSVQITVEARGVTAEELWNLFIQTADLYVVDVMEAEEGSWRMVPKVPVPSSGTDSSAESEND